MLLRKVLPNPISAKSVASMTSTAERSVRMGDTQLGTVGGFLAVSSSWAIFFILAFRTVLLSIANVLFVDTEHRHGFVQFGAATREFRFVAHHIAFKFVFTLAAIVRAITQPSFLQRKCVYNWIVFPCSSYQDASAVVASVLIRGATSDQIWIAITFIFVVFTVLLFIASELLGYAFAAIAPKLSRPTISNDLLAVILITPITTIIIAIAFKFNSDAFLVSAGKLAFDAYRWFQV